MKHITIDCAAIDSRESLHRTFSDALSLPEFYGNNLDALHDVLTAICEDTTLEIQNWPAAEVALGNYAKAARRCLTHADRNPHLTVEFH
ncbi:MAG: barstar family protein [Oscillospiraceae bacterium]|nr:barstar family protein [Oscillospiraceae bacterium]